MYVFFQNGQTNYDHPWISLKCEVIWYPVLLCPTMIEINFFDQSISTSFCSISIIDIPIESSEWEVHTSLISVMINIHSLIDI